MDKWEEKQKKYLTFFENNALIRKAILNTQGRITDINVRQQIYLYTMCPVIAMFSKWVIEEAVKRDIKKLYFMARDSYTAYLTDDYIIKKYHIDIQIKYIRLSRHSLRHSEYKNIITYLKKEGFFDEDKYGIVDSGWLGTVQQSLRDLLVKAGCKTEFDGFYFGLYEIPRQMDRKRYNGFYFNPVGGIKQKVYFSNSLYEVMNAENIGMTESYDEHGNPVLVDNEYDKNPEDDLLVLNVFNEQLFKNDGSYKGLKVDRRELFNILREFMASPCMEEIKSFGNIRFSANYGDKTDLMAARMSEKELKNLWLFARIKRNLMRSREPVRESAWQQASIILNGKHVNSNMRHDKVYRYTKYVLNGIRNIRL